MYIYNGYIYCVSHSFANVSRFSDGNFSIIFVSIMRDLFFSVAFADRSITYAQLSGYLH